MILVASFSRLHNFDKNHALTKNEYEERSLCRLLAIRKAFSLYERTWNRDLGVNVIKILNT